MPPSKRQKVTVKNIANNAEPTVGPPKGVEKCVDWRDEETKYRLRHKHALEHGILTDVNFTIGPEKTPFAAHKIFLALASPVFEAMFYGSLKETNDVIHIPDISPHGFKALLDFVYSDDVNFTNEADAFSTWIAAEKYCMPFMKDACFKYLSTCNLASTNIWGILDNALFLNSQPIIDKCKGYLKEKTFDAVNAPSFLETSKDTIECLVMLDVLQIDEIDLLRSIVKWAKEKVKNETTESLQETLHPLLRFIRFGCMAQKEFISFIEEHKNLLTDKDIVEILKYMTDSGFYSLPNWCSANVFPRKASDRPQCKNIRSYSLSAKHSLHENNTLSPNVHERHMSDSDDSVNMSDLMILPFQESRSLNGSPPMSNSSISSSFSDTTSDTTGSASEYD